MNVIVMIATSIKHFTNVTINKGKPRKRYSGGRYKDRKSKNEKPFALVGQPVLPDPKDRNGSTGTNLSIDTSVCFLHGKLKKAMEPCDTGLRACKGTVRSNNREGHSER